MSIRKIAVFENRYADSVTLMGIADSVKNSDGVELVEVQMGTPANLAVICDLGFEIPETVGVNDLFIAIEAKTELVLTTAFKQVTDRLNNKIIDEDELSYNSLAEIESEVGEYDLCQISLPGEYAAAEAEKAINMGLDVFIFSDNVPIEDELRLKLLGEKKDVLVMGPDCGVGLLNGVALATGSIIRKGPVGIVGASGSGAQEVACIVEKAGSGVSALIGTGGRDLYPQIGGLSMIKGIKRLEQDFETKIIVLVSKLADQAVMEKVLSVADSISKPVIAVFLGCNARLFDGYKVYPCFSLEAAALKAVEISTGKKVHFGYSAVEINEIVKQESNKYSKEQKYFRGIYCGGTFAEESLIYLSEHQPEIELFSNLKTPYATQLDDPLKSVGHALIDLGSEEFTLEHPHPVFDLEQRLKRFRQESEDPEVAVILLDFITGPGVNEDPISPFTAACAHAITKRNGSLTIIASICGSKNDPQKIQEKENELVAAGVIVTASNHQSSKLANALLSVLN